MKIVFPENDIFIKFTENQINILTIEDRNVFAKLVKTIWEQYCGKMGTSILSENEKILKIEKEVEVVINPFEVNVNDRKILSKIYVELTQNVSELLFEKTALINSEIVNYIDAVIQTVPYKLSQEFEMDLTGLFKLYNVKVDYEGNSLLENLIDYVRIIHQTLNKNIFIFVNLKHFLSNDELKLFYEMVFYEKIFVLIIEAEATEWVEFEHHQILDKDLCLIEY